MKSNLNILSEEFIDKIIKEAFDALEEIGILIENEEALELLIQRGCKTGENNKRIYLNRDIVMQSVDSAPETVSLYDRNGDKTVTAGAGSLTFDPGSAALNILDGETGDIRKAYTQDYIDLCRVVNTLGHIHLNSTALICSDVPEDISDSYRLYLALMYCSKPVITGIFNRESWKIMKNMLVAVRGNKKELENKPLAVFDACPSPPLKWSDLTCQSVVECARYGIPSEFVSMPLSGGTAPATLGGTLVQHTAEVLSGVVIAQTVKEGSPVIYGGSPAVMDMRTGTTPMGDIQTMMIDASYARIGAHFGLPVHSYMGLSDSRHLDYQAGMESAMGILMAALSGINIVSGPGMLDFESCQSLEKLVLDNEICGFAYRLKEGIEPREEKLASVLYDENVLDGNFLSTTHTSKWFQEELFFPSELIERDAQPSGLNSFERARERVEEILSEDFEEETLKDPAANELHSIISREAEKQGLSELPEEGY